MGALIADLDQAHHQVKQLRVFYELGQALATTFDIKRLLAETMELAANVIDAGAASILLVDEQEEELVFEVSHGTRGQLLRQQRIPIDEGIAGWVIQNGRAVIANDARSDQRFSHRVDVRTGFLTQSIAAVPLRIKGRIIGVLEVLNKYSDAGFSEEDIQLMSSIATQAAIAVENARLYQQIRQERDHVVEVQEEIRQELARNLHDGPLQHLSAINMSLDHLQRLSVKGNPEAVQTQIEALQTLAHQAARDARNLLFELRPLILETEGLVAALEQYVNQLNNSERFTVRLKTVEALYQYQAKMAGTIFAIVQEAMDNVKRHADADHVWLLAESQNDHIAVTIRDDGQGFELDIIDDPYNRHACFGLLNMRERAALMGAELKIDSRTTPPQRGTTVQLILPLPTEESR
jgi:signal transduction histidine kinase